MKFFVFVLVLLFSFASTIKINQKSSCTTTNCDIEEKLTTLFRTLNDGLYDSMVLQEKAERMILGKLAEHNQNITSRLRSQASSTENVIVSSVSTKIDSALQTLENKMMARFTALALNFSASLNDHKVEVSNRINILKSSVSEVFNFLKNFSCLQLYKPTTMMPMPSVTPKPIKDCSDESYTAGVITLQSGVQVKCNRGWTSVMNMNRADKLNVNRNWREYEVGFGTLTRSHWTGLRKITNIMSSKSRWQMRYTAYSFYKWNGNENVVAVLSGTYDDVKIDANKDYTLTLGKFQNAQRNDVFNCQIKNACYRLHNQKFSTYDHGNDNAGGDKASCARSHKAGFWWNNCGWIQHEDYTTPPGRIGHLHTCETQHDHYYLSDLRIEIRPM